MMKKLIIIMSWAAWMVLSGMNAWAISPAPISPQERLKRISGVRIPSFSDGLLAGSITNPNAAVGTGDMLHGFGYQETLCFSVGIGGCIYEHTYGSTVDWDFNVSGALTYNYGFPFSISFGMPDNVYVGQRIFLNTPTIMAPRPELTATQDYSYSHVSIVRADAPGDGMDDVVIRFSQYADHANIGAAIPVLPLTPSITGETDVTFPPFNTGGGSYGGSYTRMGGTGRLSTSVPTGSLNAYNANPTSVCVYANATSDVAWKQGHEQFELTAYVLRRIPATKAIGDTLEGIRLAGKFKLNTQLEGRIERTDFVCMELSDPPYVDVLPANVQDGFWTFTDLPVTLNYRVYGMSYFAIKLGYDVTFDMRGIDPKPIRHGDIGDPWLIGRTRWPISESEWENRQGMFKISGKVPVFPKPQGLQPAARKISLGPRPQQMIPPPGMNFATPGLKSKIVNPRRTVMLPKPTAQRGVPQAGEYTVVLGEAAKAKADEIVSLLKRKGISAYAVTKEGSRQPVVTLGVFMDRAQAELLAATLKDAYRIDGVVVRSLAEAKLEPLGDDVVQRLKARRL